jgi:RNA polymerase sigma factor (sigma-70 family)
MATRASTATHEGALLAAARSGDEVAFERLLEPHRRVLRAHCYRLLGSLHDAEDAFQETSLRAWRSLDRFEPRGSFRGWLYRIATNVCLRAIERRERAPEALDVEEAWIASYLQPFPDRLLDTEAAVEERESLGLAFVSVIQLLLIRAVGPAALQPLVDAMGHRERFRRFQKQPAWRERTIEEQLRSFVRNRKLDYVAALVGALDLTRVPRPLHRVLAHVWPT